MQPARQAPARPTQAGCSRPKGSRSRRPLPLGPRRVTRRLASIPAAARSRGRRRSARLRTCVRAAPAVVMATGRGCGCALRPEGGPSARVGAGVGGVQRLTEQRVCAFSDFPSRRTLSTLFNSTWASGTGVECPDFYDGNHLALLTSPFLLG